MKVLIEEHYKCGICGGCFHSDKEAAEDCCSILIERVFNGVTEEEFQQKLKQ